MSRLVWGEPGKRFYETGIDRGVFYPLEGVGVPWNGLIAVSEAPSGADVTSRHYDGEQFIQQRQSESFAAKLRAYTYPQEFEGYDGTLTTAHSAQGRKLFNLSYRTMVMNDQASEPTYLIHLVYNAVVSPSNRSYSSLGSSAQALTFEWNLETVPEILPSGEFSAHFIINSAIAYPWAMTALEDILYGSTVNDSRFPSVTELFNIFENASILRITDNGDGTWTADGPDEAFSFGPDGYFEITWPSVIYIDTNTYRISSL